jgi:hypothetical protein
MVSKTHSTAIPFAIWRQWLTRKSRFCREPPYCREAIGHKENIRQTMDGRELRLRIEKDTDLNRPAYRAHVNFRPQNVGSDNITFVKAR